MREVSGEPKELGGGALSGPVPVAQGLVCEVGSLLMHQSKDIHQRSSAAVTANTQALLDLDKLAAKVKRVALEPVPSNERCCRGLPLCARQGHIDRRWDSVGELVLSQRCLQTQRSQGRAQRDLDEVEIDQGRVYSAVEPTCDALQLARFDQTDESGARNAGLYRRCGAEGEGQA
ncbi:MAG: hypothetical protein ACI9MC_002080 [Kiritimatiellia bacterium]|jgi:hypothetical protein